MPEYKVENATVWKIAGLAATFAAVALHVAGIVTDEQFVQVAALLATLGVWVLPSPVIRTGGGK